MQKNPKYSFNAMMLAVEAEYNDRIAAEVYRNPNNEVEGIFFAIKDRVNQGN